MLQNAQIIYFTVSELLLENQQGVKLLIPSPKIRVKYLGIHISKVITWKYSINNVGTKLNKANTLLSQTRHFVYIKTLKPTNHAIFESHILTVHWFRHKIHFQLKDCINTLVDVFLNRIAYTESFFEKLAILKLSDNVALDKCL